MSTSSDSLDLLECCEFSLLGVVVVAGSGTCTDSGNGEVGRGLCDASALVPKLGCVGVVASSKGFGSWVGAVLGLGVIGDGWVPSFVCSAANNGWLTGRNAAAMMKGCVPRKR
jgi:hypothetical protein